MCKKKENSESSPEKKTVTFLPSVLDENKEEKVLIITVDFNLDETIIKLIRLLPSHQEIFGAGFCSKHPLNFLIYQLINRRFY